MSINEKLKELKQQELNCNIFDVYNYSGLSMQELLSQFFTKINECVGLTNTMSDYVEFLKEEGISNEIIEKLQLKINDGSISSLLNIDKINNLQTQINDLVLGAVGDGNNAEIINARGGYETLNDRLNNIDEQTNVLLNNKNLFKNKTIKDKTDWFTIGEGYLIKEGTNFSNSIEIVNKTKTYLYQDIKNLKNGEYILSFKTHNDNLVENLKATVSIIGYPTSASSNGTVLFTVDDTNIWDYTKNKGYQNTLLEATLMAEQYDHCRVLIEFRNIGRTYNLCEFYFAEKSNNYNGFSYIADKLNSFNSNITNKSLYINGDSISFGAGYTDGYGKILSDKYKCVVTNNAVSGGTLASGTLNTDGSKRHYINESVINTVNKQYDYMILSGGFNDYGNNVPLGSLSNSPYCFSNPIDNNTLIGALENMFRHVLKNYPTTKLYFLLTHKVNRALNEKNTLGLTLSDYMNAIKCVCERYSIPIINVWDESRFITYYDNIANNYTMNNDRVHPNFEGYNKFYIPVIEKELNL